MQSHYCNYMWLQFLILTWECKESICFPCPQAFLYRLFLSSSLFFSFFPSDFFISSIIKQETTRKLPFIFLLYNRSGKIKTSPPKTTTKNKNKTRKGEKRVNEGVFILYGIKKPSNSVVMNVFQNYLLIVVLWLCLLFFPSFTM